MDDSQDRAEPAGTRESLDRWPLHVYAPPSSVPTDEDVALQELDRRQSWEKYNLPERSQLP